MEHYAAIAQLTSAALDKVASKVPVSSKNHERMASYFLGNKAENQDIFERLVAGVLSDHAEARRSYHPEDPAFISLEMRESTSFLTGINSLEKNFEDLCGLLEDFSVPFYSPRYAGHMCFETSMPAILGYMSTILFNPNNGFRELEVGTQMCRMLGYEIDATSTDSAWGHIACDGTVANLESIWAARNLKFYPLSLREAMKDGRTLAFISDSFKVHPCAKPDEEVLFSSLGAWDLLNLRVTEILNIPDRLQEQYGISANFLQDALQPYLVQTTGKDALEKEWEMEKPAQYLISNTKHYSWPKGAAIAGIGSENMVNVPVDHNARVSIEHLEKALEDHLANKQPVYAVVAIIGSTEEGAVDPVDKILQLRHKFEKKGLSFVIHADAAWGGYFASMIRNPNEDTEPDKTKTGRDVRFVPSMTLRTSTVSQFNALKACDSITIDPHKSGYIPYPAGGLCYKDGRMRNLLTWSAPYLSQGQNGENIGMYGVEGSKPGAPAAAVWLHHAVVGLHKEGHGMLLGEVAFTCARFSAHWAAMSDKSTPFIVVPFNPLVNESDEERLIRKHVLPKSNEELIRNRLAMKELRALGSDLNINAFACNFRIDGKDNNDVEEANYLNNRIYQALSVTSTDAKPADTPMFLSATTLAMADYGDCCTNFKKRMGLEIDSNQDLFVLRNVVMSPFQSAGNFVKQLADIFQETLEREMKVVVARNTIAPQKLTFVMQGTDKLFLVFNPTFHHVNGRRQVILSATFQDDHSRKSYVSSRTKNPTEVYIMETKGTGILTDLLDQGMFTASIRGKGLSLPLVRIKNLQVIKDRTLQSRYRDPHYPSPGIPFYLYGTEKQQHIDHMLLRAPNCQLCSDQVELDLDTVLPATELANGLIAIIDRHEASMQPMNEKNPPNFFAAGAKYGITVYTDEHAPDAKGPGLGKVNPGSKIATGSITLGRSVRVEYENLNNQDFGQGRCNHLVNAASRSMDELTKREWMTLLKERVGCEYGF